MFSDEHKKFLKNEADFDMIKEYFDLHGKKRQPASKYLIPKEQLQESLQEFIAMFKDDQAGIIESLFVVYEELVNSLGEQEISPNEFSILLNKRITELFFKANNITVH